MVQGKSFVFVWIFLRDEVSACIETSYNQISQKEACRMLFFDKEGDLLKYASKVRVVVSGPLIRF